jgi:integrase
MPQSRTRKNKNKKKKHATSRRRPADDLRQVAQLVVYTGLRESEVIRLKRTDVDLDTGKMSTRVVLNTAVEAYEALHHLETLLHATIARGGHEAQPMDEATARAEQRQVFRIGTYHESGVNAVCDIAS